MEAPSLAAVTAAPLELDVDGVKVPVKPIGASILGKWTEKLIEQRLSILPGIGEVLRELQGLDPSSVREALKTLAELRRDASEPSMDEFMNWIGSDIRWLTGIVYDCIDDTQKDKYSLDQIFKSMIREMQGGSFAQRWLELSGFGGNPT